MSYNNHADLGSTKDHVLRIQGVQAVLIISLGILGTLSTHDINGSVIETIFGQMRQVAQHNLSAAN